MIYFFGLALAVGIGLPIAVIGAGLGQGKVGASAMEGIARNPEAVGRIQINMIIALAFIESLVIYSLLITFMILPRVPTFQQAMEALKAAGGG